MSKKPFLHPAEILDRWTLLPLSQIPRLTEYHWDYENLRARFLEWLFHEEAMRRGFYTPQRAWEMYTRVNIPGMPEYWRGEIAPHQSPVKNSTEGIMVHKLNLAEARKKKLGAPYTTKDFQEHGREVPWGDFKG